MERTVAVFNPRMPKLSTLLIAALGFFVFASISIAPNGTRKPVINADGTVAHTPEGRVLTEIDGWGYVKKNWFGFLALFLTCVCLALGVVRLAWNGWLRIRNPRHETTPS
jgi:hypothetical protein